MSKLWKLIDWRGLIFIVSLPLIFDTAIYPYVDDGFLKWKIVAQLTLASEMNIAVWWASGLLLLSGLAAVHIAGWDIKFRRAWAAISVLFFFLSLDELGSIHERVGNLVHGDQDYILIAVAMGSLLLYAMWALWRNKSDKHGLVLLLLGLALLFTAAPNEYLEHHFNWTYYLTGPRTAVEEGLELMGAFLCLSSIARYESPVKLEELGSTSSEKNHFRTILLAGFAVHIGLAWVSANYIEIGFRGNPAVWYFMSVLVAVAIFFLLKAKSIVKPASWLYVFSFFYFALMSIAGVYFILPSPVSILNDLGWIANSNVILASQLVLIFVLYWFLFHQYDKQKLTLFLAAAVSLASGWYLKSQFVNYIAAGVFALVTGTLFLSNENTWRTKDDPVA